MNPYLLILTPIIATAIAQIIKIILGRRNKMKIDDFFKFSYSGMPSGHSTFVASLATIIALSEGITSPIFAVTLAFSIIVVNDALRLRRYLGKQGEVINVLVEDLKEDQFLDKKYPILKERIGHTETEVLAGLILGMIIGIVIFVLF